MVKPPPPPTEVDPSKPGLYSFRGPISQYIKATLDRNLGSVAEPSRKEAELEPRVSIEKEIEAAGAPMSKEDEDLFSHKIKSVLNLNE